MFCFLTFLLRNEATRDFLFFFSALAFFLFQYTYFWFLPFFFLCFCPTMCLVHRQGLFFFILFGQPFALIFFSWFGLGGYVFVLPQPFTSLDSQGLHPTVIVKLHPWLRPEAIKNGARPPILLTDLCERDRGPGRSRPPHATPTRLFFIQAETRARSNIGEKHMGSPLLPSPRALLGGILFWRGGPPPRGGG